MLGWRSIVNDDNSMVERFGDVALGTGQNDKADAGYEYRISGGELEFGCNPRGRSLRRPRELSLYRLSHP